jgi:hypothetical protein
LNGGLKDDRQYGYVLWAMTPIGGEKAGQRTIRSDAAAYFVNVVDYLKVNFTQVEYNERQETLTRFERGIDYYGKNLVKSGSTTRWSNGKKCVANGKFPVETLPLMLQNVLLNKATPPKNTLQCLLTLSTHNVGHELLTIKNPQG